MTAAAAVSLFASDAEAAAAAETAAHAEALGSVADDSSGPPDVLEAVAALAARLRADRLDALWRAHRLARCPLAAMPGGDGAAAAQQAARLLDVLTGRTLDAGPAAWRRS